MMASTQHIFARIELFYWIICETNYIIHSNRSWQYDVWVCKECIKFNRCVVMVLNHIALTVGGLLVSDIAPTIRIIFIGLFNWTVLVVKHGFAVEYEEVVLKCDVLFSIQLKFRLFQFISVDVVIVCAMETAQIDLKSILSCFEMRISSLGLDLRLVHMQLRFESVLLDKSNRLVSFKRNSRN